MLVAAGLAVPAAAIPRALAPRWAPVRLIDQVEPLSQPFAGEGVCPSASLCVIAGVDAVETSTHPAGGPRAWHTTLLPGAVRLVHLACPSTRECLGSFGFNRLAISRDPTGGPRAWRTIRLPAAVTEVNSLACADAHRCLIVGSGGLVAWSASPTAGRAAWHTGRVRGAGDLESVSCPSASLCVAAGGSGEIAVSTRPLGGPATWRVIHLHLTTSYLAVRCVSTRLCLGSDGGDRLIASTDPSGGAGAWHSLTLGRGGAAQLDVPVCPSASFCLAGDGRGSVFVSADPSGGARAWHRVRVDFDAGVLACVGARACASRGISTAASPPPPTPDTRPAGGRWRGPVATISPRSPARPPRCAWPARTPAICCAGAGPRARRWRDTGFARVLRRRYRGGAGAGARLQHPGDVPGDGRLPRRRG